MSGLWAGGVRPSRLVCHEGEWNRADPPHAYAVLWLLDVVNAAFHSLEEQSRYEKAIEAFANK